MLLFIVEGLNSSIPAAVAVCIIGNCKEIKLKRVEAKNLKRVEAKISEAGFSLKPCLP